MPETATFSISAFATSLDRQIDATRREPISEAFKGRTALSLQAGVPVSGVDPLAPPPRLRRDGPRTSSDQPSGWPCRGWAGPFPWFETHLS